MKIVLFFCNMNSMNYVQELVPRNYSEIKKQIKEVIGNTCDFLQESFSYLAFHHLLSCFLAWFIHNDKLSCKKSQVLPMTSLICFLISE